MKFRRQRGGGDIDGIVILAILAIIIIVTPKNPSPPQSDITPGTSLFNTISGVNPRSIKGKSAPALTRAMSSSIEVGSGNAPYVYQPFEEYVTIENRGSSS